MGAAPVWVLQLGYLLFALFPAILHRRAALHAHCQPSDINSGAESLPQTSRRSQIVSVIMEADQHRMSANLQKVQCLLGKDVITQCAHPLPHFSPPLDATNSPPPLPYKGNMRKVQASDVGRGIHGLTCNKENAWNP